MVVGVWAPTLLPWADFALPGTLILSIKWACVNDSALSSCQPIGSWRARDIVTLLPAPGGTEQRLTASRGRCGVENLGASSANHGKSLKGPQINSHFLPDHHELLLLLLLLLFSEVYLPLFLWPAQNRNVEAPNLLSWLVLTAVSPKSS